MPYILYQINTAQTSVDQMCFEVCFSFHEPPPADPLSDSLLFPAMDDQNQTLPEYMCDTHSTDPNEMDPLRPSSSSAEAQALSFLLLN